MTNFDSATRSFNLCTEGTQSYSWAWQGIARAQALKEIEETGNDIASYASGWAWELSHACISQIDENGERGFTAAEIAADLRDDRESLAAALEDWLSEGDDDQEPEPTAPTIPTAREMAEQGLLLCTSSLGGRGITPTGVIYIFSSYEDFIDQNSQWHWVQLPDPCWHGVTIIDIDLPVEGGYQAEWGGNPTRKSDGYTYYP